MPLFFYDRLLPHRHYCRTRFYAHIASFSLFAIFLLTSPSAQSSSLHSQSIAVYARAERTRARLYAVPASVRTREDYERTLDAYRSVYHGDPGSPDAARSIAATADLLAEEGRSFHDARLTHDAMAQWEFLRREYPGSPLRQRALFQEAQIEQLDLHNRATARSLYSSFLSYYPHDPLAEQARAALSRTPQRHPVEEPGSPHETNRTITARSMQSPAAVQPVVSAPQELISLRAPAGLQPSATTIHTTHAPIFPEAVFSADRNNPAPVTDRVSAAQKPLATIRSVRYWTEGNATRLAIDLSGPIPYRTYLAADGNQITLIFFGARPLPSFITRPILVGLDSGVATIHATMLTSNQTELVVQLSRAVTFSSFLLSNPERLILDVRAARRQPAIAETSHALLLPGNSSDAVPQKSRATNKIGKPMLNVSGEPDLPTEVDPSWPSIADGQHTMARVLGLRIRRIVIDAGHGGHDSGTLGPDGIEEKDIALDVALRVGRLLHRQLGADVIYTRQTDTFIPLQERTAIANRAHADLFLSIHANSSPNPDVRGIETYFLNFTASPDALQVAARENAISNRSVHDLSDLVRKIALSDKIDESREFAGNVQQALFEGLAGNNPNLKNRGVKQAPFVVLIGANMPSILAEISFLTNPEDASELSRPAYRQHLAEALYRGVARYVDGMSGVHVAKTIQPARLSQPAE